MHLIPNNDTNKCNPNRQHSTQYCHNLRSNAHVIPYTNAVVKKSMGNPEGYSALSCGEDSAMWTRTYTNDLERLAQGQLGLVTATKTIFFILCNQVPTDHKVI